MATKEYLSKYRQLKKAYERIIGKSIADVTWYRVVGKLKRYFGFEVEASSALLIVESFADLKRRYGAFSFNSSDFNERWTTFKHFYDGEDIEYTCKQFLALLAEYLKIDLEDVPRSTRYYWFDRAGVKYQADEYRRSRDLALVAFVATNWAIAKRAATMKSANPDDNNLAA
ncbi:hypothetical protein [Tolypothrix sp. VBCCA 56010]|uniref:hypothetical protein n=1 Tax=Tolypothrix sp. VBCCA 56010 TaxID=3137731 RepID=UPI003D7E7B68